MVTGWLYTNPSEKYEFVNGFRMTSHIFNGKCCKCLKPPTSHEWIDDSSGNSWLDLLQLDRSHLSARAPPGQRHSKNLERFPKENRRSIYIYSLYSLYNSIYILYIYSLIVYNLYNLILATRKCCEKNA